MNQSPPATAQGPALVWCPFPSVEEAERVADTLLDEGLIACANILPQVRSRYVWQGHRESAEETGVLFKTDAAKIESLVTRLSYLHPYAEPAILGWRCDFADPATVAWLGALVQ